MPCGIKICVYSPLPLFVLSVNSYGYLSFFVIFIISITNPATKRKLEKYVIDEYVFILAIWLANDGDAGDVKWVPGANR